jgi:hypothetical protein
VHTQACRHWDALAHSCRHDSGLLRFRVQCSASKLEYLHIELPGQTVTLASPPPSTPGVFINYRFNRESVDLVRVGVSYTFDWAAP